MRGASVAAAVANAPARSSPPAAPIFAHAHDMFATCWGSSRCASIHRLVILDAKASVASRAVRSTGPTMVLPPPSPSPSPAVSFASAWRMLAISWGLKSSARAFAAADVVSKIEMHYPRSHPSPIEACGSIADFDRATSKLTVYMTTQAPHIIRAAVALVAELPEHMIRIIAPDLGGRLGNKVPVYPGYVASILASILLERPVKWI